METTATANTVVAMPNIAVAVPSMALATPMEATAVPNLAAATPTMAVAMLMGATAIFRMAMTLLLMGLAALNTSMVSAAISTATAHTQMGQPMLAHEGTVSIHSQVECLTTRKIKAGCKAQGRQKALGNLGLTVRGQGSRGRGQAGTSPMTKGQVGTSLRGSLKSKGREGAVALASPACKITGGELLHFAYFFVDPIYITIFSRTKYQLAGTGCTKHQHEIPGCQHT